MPLSWMVTEIKRLLIATRFLPRKSPQPRLNTDFENFVLWFQKPLENLFTDDHAGFPILMISLPLIERYLRQKCACYEGNLNAAFYQEFGRLFSIPNASIAEKLWHVYRNGLLHQVALSGANRAGTIMPKAALSGHVPLLSYDSVFDIFYVSPVPFAKLVLTTIESDFPTFLAAGSVNHPFPHVTPYGTTASAAFIPVGIPPPTGRY